MLCVLILAGGRGKRLYPISTEDKPKQFLRLCGKKTMLQITFERFRRFIQKDSIYISTTRSYRDIVKEQLPDVDDDNIIIEPVGMNTAPCIAISSHYINKRIGNVSLIVSPSDHIIDNEDKLCNTIYKAYEFVESNEKSIVLLGIQPKYNEVDYGYIKRGNEVGSSIYTVDKFVEKPKLELAKTYVESGMYYWNSGVFISKVNTVLDCVDKYLPKTSRLIKNIDLGGYIPEEDYKNVECVSIDYAIFEKYRCMNIIECDFGWVDIGSIDRLKNYNQIISN
ncbi:MAG: mannose-1-phosphate guanylyltransferase [Candidatus Anstonellales archaeon]